MIDLSCSWFLCIPSSPPLLLRGSQTPWIRLCWVSSPARVPASDEQSKRPAAGLLTKGGRRGCLGRTRAQNRRGRWWASRPPHVAKQRDHPQAEVGAQGESIAASVQAGRRTCRQSGKGNTFEGTVTLA